MLLFFCLLFCCKIVSVLTLKFYIMKKRNLKSLSLKRELVSNLSEKEMHSVNGGEGILSIGKNCTQPSHCRSDHWSDGIFCNTNRCWN